MFLSRSCIFRRFSDGRIPRLPKSLITTFSYRSLHNPRNISTDESPCHGDFKLGDPKSKEINKEAIDYRIIRRLPSYCNSEVGSTSIYARAYLFEVLDLYEALALEHRKNKERVSVRNSLKLNMELVKLHFQLLDTSFMFRENVIRPLKKCIRGEGKNLPHFSEESLWRTAKETLDMFEGLLGKLDDKSRAEVVEGPVGLAAKKLDGELQHAKALLREALLLCEKYASRLTSLPV